MIKPRGSSAAIFKYRGHKMLGILNRPQGPEGRKFPGVLFLHGFPGAEKNVDIQRKLLEQGIASFALHFCGAWGSGGTYSFTDLVPQARAGLRFFLKKKFVDPRRLAVFGFSMGGWTAINLAARGRRFKAAVAISPVGGPEMLSPDTKENIAYLSRPLRVKSLGFLYKDLLKALHNQDPNLNVAKIACPILLVHGDLDEVVPVAVSRRLYEAAKTSKKLVIAAGARHDFLDRRQWLSGLVSDWLAKRLKV